MKTLNLTGTLDDERLAPLLPLVASVWEDGELSDLEIAAVCMAVIQNPEVDLSCKEALRHWLDPNHPPSAHDLEDLNARISRRGDPDPV
jgi:hypothetical protein